MVSMKYLYADTSVWNCLCDQHADPGALSLALANRKVGFAIGFNVFHEIAKLFFTATEKDAERGRELFAYMKRCLASPAPIIKENWALLIEEALDVTGNQPMESCFLDAGQHQLAVQKIDKLCRGDVAPEVGRYFDGRKSLVQTSRTNMKDHLEDRPDLKAILNRVTDDGLLGFLRKESVGPAGQVLLLGHLVKEFPNNSPNELAGVARRLLQIPRYRLSHVMTRADLYLNWRCVKRGSIRGDLPDDTFHVVSAAYCDIFVTTEADQANIARHAIEGVQAIITNRNELISNRLLQELETTVGAAASK